jgi:hypothetical protein
MSSQLRSKDPGPVEINASLFEFDEADENIGTQDTAASSCPPTIQPSDQKGDAFQPLDIDEFELCIKNLPSSPLLLFQAFIHIHLVQLWVQYTNEHVEFLLRESKPAFRARLRAWFPTTVDKVYLWLGVLIYIGIHKEIRLRDH